MSSEERKAVTAVTLFQEVRRRRRELERLKLEGVEDPHKEKILSVMVKELEDKT